MAEEVVIKVVQENQGTAISDARRELDALKKEQEEASRAILSSGGTYAETQTAVARLNTKAAAAEKSGPQGMFDAADMRAKAADLGKVLEAADAASAARAEKIGALEKTVTRETAAEKKKSDGEAMRAAKDHGAERKKAEKEVAEEERRREAVKTARMRAAGRGVDAFESGSGINGLGSIGPLLANPLTALAVGIGAYIGKAVSQAAEKIAAIRQSEEKAGFAAGRRHRIMGRTNPLLGESEATGEVNANVAALEDAQDKKGKFKDTEPVRDFIRGAFGFETSGQKKERENDLEINRLKQNLPGDAAQAETKFREGAGGAELEARRAGLAYDMQGKRFAEDKVAAMKEYHRVLQSVGGEHATAQGKAMAEEAATDAVREKQRERAGNVAGLVNARTGTRGTAQLARIAAGLDDPERAGKVFAAALKPVINAAAQPPLHNWMPGKRP